MGTHLWDSLNEEEQKWVQESMDLSVIEQRKLWMQSEKESLDAVRAAGVIVSYPNKTKFSEISKSVIEEYEQDPYFKDVIVKIKKTL
jgi:TRAP-type C4-dicarboxylate transport system substrate-binding protein